jgi:hypothetical protein
MTDAECITVASAWATVLSVFRWLALHCTARISSMHSVGPPHRLSVYRIFYGKCDHRLAPAVRVVPLPSTLLAPIRRSARKLLEGLGAGPKFAGWPRLAKVPSKLCRVLETHIFVRLLG